MRYTPTVIRHFLAAQSQSGQSVADFCAEHALKVPTFYAWRKKYEPAPLTASKAGFCQITPVNEEMIERRLYLPSGLGVELAGLSLGEIADLIVKIDRAHA